jgi:hypothetical protein
MSQVLKSYPSAYPYNRQWGIDSVSLPRYMTLQNNWDKSRQLIEQIREHLNKAEIHPAVETVAAAGSIGRMEASPDVSDADLIIVLSNETDLPNKPEPESEAMKAYESVWKAIQPLSIDLPKRTGVFALPTTEKQLLNNVGKADESLTVFGKRLLLLLETQPVYKDENYTHLINSIVDRYADKYVKIDSKKEWTLLLNDLIRYFRSLAVNYQWDFDKELEKWPLRNIKLRTVGLTCGMLGWMGQNLRSPI